MDRRKFLKNSSKAAVGAIAFPYLIPSSALGKAGTIAPSNRITIGVIGLHNQGTNVHLANLVGMDECRVLALCDADMALCRDRKGKVDNKYGNKDITMYQDFRELIRRDDIDSVLIATPDHWHAIISIAAADAGKHVYCEKPMAHSISEGRAIINAVKRNGVVFQTGSQQRSEANFLHGCELAQNGYLGKINLVQASIMSFPDEHQKPFEKANPIPQSLDYDRWLGPAPYRPFHQHHSMVNWRWCYDYGGGQIMDWIGHNWDIGQWGMGADHTGPTEIDPVFVKWVKPGFYHTIGTFEFRAKYSEGFDVMVATQNAPGQTTFVGEEGQITCNRGGNNYSNSAYRDIVIKPGEKHLHASPGNSHHKDFFNAIRTGGDTVAPAEAGHRSASLGLLGLIALRLGRKLKWDPINEQFIGDDEANRMLVPTIRGPWTL